MRIITARVRVLLQQRQPRDGGHAVRSQIREEEQVEEVQTPDETTGREHNLEPKFEMSTFMFKNIF
jgi:hypothetical protein